MNSNPSTPPGLTIRPASPSDAATILRFIQELAHFEREPNAVIATEADLLRDGWGLAADGLTPLLPAQPARFSALIAGLEGAPAGFALYFTSYSTWLGHHGIRLEDIYVTPALRGRGIGKALLARLARIALDQGCSRLEWDVLDWNEPAIAVYRRIGATLQSDWRIMRLTADALHKLATTDDQT